MPQVLYVKISIPPRFILMLLFCVSSCFATIIEYHNKKNKNITEEEARKLL